MMSLAGWSRLSGYVALGLSCATLVFAEEPFLPDLRACLPPVLVLLGMAWWAEGRWSVPGWGANLLGLCILGGGAAWLVVQLHDEESLLARLPLHLALLPYVGPLVMAALLVKVFQRRAAGDFWRLQGLGLMQVGLACVLEGGAAFGALLAGYLAAALACLALHYRQACGDGAPPRAGWLAALTLRWALLVGGPALLLFLLTPRRDGSAWEPLANVRPTAGRGGAGRAGADEEINLNGTGPVELDDGVAFHVSAVTESGRPRTDLPAGQRWRGGVLDLYADGRWSMSHRAMSAPPLRRRQPRLPDFGPGQSYLTFTVQPRQAGVLVLAEPVRLGPPSARLPVRSLAAEPALFAEVSGTLAPLHVPARHEYRYLQVVPAGAADRVPAAERWGERHLEKMMLQGVPQGLAEWTVGLLRRLAGRPRPPLPARVRNALAGPTRSFLIEPDDWEAVARALRDHLASSGEYTYTLERTRQDPSLDPVMDFLIHVKQGYCERYATALALMLRSVGIPARVIKGYHGAEHEGDGNYVVRHRDAHAWVEVLVPRPGPGRPEFDWLTLDPTPAESAASSGFSLGRWWQGGQVLALRLWQTLVVDYSADEQADLWQQLRGGRLASGLRLGLGALLALVLFRLFRVLRRLRSGGAPRPRPTGTAALYARLVRLLARHAALRPGPAQTPREYGEAASAYLRARPGLAALADLPGRVVELLYRVRFGGRPLGEEERQALDTELNRLSALLRHPPPSAAAGGGPGRG